MHFYVEVDDTDGLRMVRAHRTWYGRPPKGLEKVEVPGYASDEPVIYAFQPEPDEAPEGMTAATGFGGMLVTAEPDRYGDPAAREASGKKAPRRLALGEWTLLL